MKRIFSALMIMVMAFLMTSCLEIEKKRDPKEMLEREEKLDMGERTTDISDGISDDKMSFSYSCDLDYDEKNEDILISIVNVEEYEQKIEISVGDRKTEFDCFGGTIEKVYSCDIKENDKTRDIAVITNEESDDPRIRILSYGDDLKAYEFYDKYSEAEINDNKWLGYASNYHFVVNADDNDKNEEENVTITLETQTNSLGMWSVSRKYELKDNIFEEIVYDKYSILPDFMQKMEHFDENVTEEEKEKWRSGYIKANVEYSNNSIIIEEGEYIKPLYDNDKDRIYVEKENGEEGYIDIGYSSDFPRDEFNHMFFFLAG